MSNEDMSEQEPQKEYVFNRERDKIGMIAFRGNQADTLLPLCSSVDLAVESLKELPTGGRTPLAQKVHDIVIRENKLLMDLREVWDKNGTKH